MSSKPEIYVSTDVEAHGPIPSPHSMLSFASAYLADKTLVGTFTADSTLLQGATGHPDTMAWWSQNQTAWEAPRVNCEPPETAMRNYVATKRNMPKAWFDKLPHTHVALDDAIEKGALFCNMRRMQLER